MDAKGIHTKIQETNPNKYSLYYLEKEKRYVSEYYIRPISKIEQKYKNLIETEFKDFEIDEDKIKRDFWRAQKEPINQVKKFMNELLIPILKDKKIIIPVDKMCDWDIVYKKSLTTKNENWFIIPHDNFDIVVQKSVMWVNLFVLAPNFYYRSEYKKEDRSCIFTFTYGVEFSDDEYVERLTAMTKSLIKSFEVAIETQNYFIHPDYDIKKSLEFYKEPFEYTGYLNEQASLPGYEYTRMLFDISILKRDLFNWND